MTQCVYVAPHADDESLSMGLHILMMLSKGHDCHVVLMSEGGDTGAIRVLNGVLSNPPVSGCVYHGYSHHPIKEFYADALLDQAEIGAARKKEFVSALGAMATVTPDTGVVAGILTYEFAGFPNSFGVTIPPPTAAVDAVETYLRDLVSRYPGATYFTMSESDQQADHAACGKALRRLKNSPDLGAATATAQFFVSKLYWKVNNNNVYPAPLLAVTNNGATLGWIDSHDLGARYVELSNLMRNRVIKPYQAWSPADGVYGIGYHSVKSQFEDCFGAGVNVFCLVHP